MKMRHPFYEFWLSSLTAFSFWHALPADTWGRTWFLIAMTLALMFCLFVVAFARRDK